MTSTVFEALRRSPLGQALPERALASLAQIAAVETYPAGTELFAEGDTHQRLYLICQGCVALEMVTASCGRQRILSGGPGDLIAWSALLGNGLMTATAVTTEPTRLIVFDSEELRARCEAEPTLGYPVMKWIAEAVSRRLLATRIQLLDVFRPAAAPPAGA